MAEEPQSLLVKIMLKTVQNVIQECQSNKGPYASYNELAAEVTEEVIEELKTIFFKAAEHNLEELKHYLDDLIPQCKVISADNHEYYYCYQKFYVPDTEFSIIIYYGQIKYTIEKAINDDGYNLLDMVILHHCNSGEAEQLRYEIFQLLSNIGIDAGIPHVPKKLTTLEMAKIHGDTIAINALSALSSKAQSFDDPHSRTRDIAGTGNSEDKAHQAEPDDKSHSDDRAIDSSKQQMHNPFWQNSPSTSLSEEDILAEIPKLVISKPNASP